MKKKLIARPTFNRISGKWNIAIETDKGEIKLGNMVDKFFMKYVEFDSKKLTEDYIKNDDRLELKNPMSELLKKYGRGNIVTD